MRLQADFELRTARNARLQDIERSIQPRQQAA
jgi:hypothetical protein